MVEHATVNRDVEGSSPSSGAMRFSTGKVPQGVLENRKGPTFSECPPREQIVRTPPRLSGFFVTNRK